MFEKCVTVNEKRFNYMSLPKILSQNKRTKGAVDFKQLSQRKELFPQKAEQPNYYNPNYDAVQPKRVNSIVRMDRRRSNLEVQDDNYIDWHMI